MLGQQNIYVLRDKETAEFRYAPLFALMMSGLAWMDEDYADTVWYILNFCLLIISFILLKKLIIPNELHFRRFFILYVLTILAVLRFILHNLDSGQTNILMLASMLIGLYYISRKQELLGGAALAFSIMIKYTPLIFIPYFIIRRKFKLSLIIALFIVIYLALPAFFTGFKTNLLYVKGLIPYLTNSTILDKMTILDPKNQSLLSFFHRIFTRCVMYFYAPVMPFQSLNVKEGAINLIFTLSAFALYLAILYVPKRIRLNKKTSFFNHLDYAALFICAALFNLNAWMPNYIFLAYAYFLLIFYLMQHKPKDITVSIFMISSFILNIATIKVTLGKTLSYKLHFYSPFTISALIILFLLLKIKYSILRHNAFK